MPVAQIMASVPATALFPFIIVLVVRTTHSMNLASIILLLSGMQWYLLFNLLAGVGAFPAEMREASRTLGLSGMLFVRKVFLPFLYPSLLTGSITAFGGGWNALIVAEYVVYDNKDYGVRGIGAFLDRATYNSGNEILVVSSLLLMTGVVVMLNRLFWTPLYERVTSNYGYHG
jgi:NitT/TauT family transport system permease protein